MESFRFFKDINKESGQNCTHFEMDQINRCQMDYTVSTFDRYMSLLRTIKKKALMFKICDDQNLFDNVMYANVNATWMGQTGPELANPRRLVGNGGIFNTFFSTFYFG